jgi:hypothetical protein
LFWILPDNVKPSTDRETDQELENNIPYIYRKMGMIEIQTRDLIP